MGNLYLDLEGNEQTKLVFHDGEGYAGCTQESLSTTATAKNQISGFCYDAAGNLLAQSAPPCPWPTYSYNAENQLTATSGVTYTYDGDGKRVSKANTSQPTQPFKLFWTGIGNDPLAETDGAGNNPDEYIFFGGKRIARRDSSVNVNYYFADHLGTARMVTNATGTILDDSDFYPFGGERVVQSSSGNSYKFTGKERDSESGLDDFGARYYGSTMGRFLSSDEGPLREEDPQSLNRYGYVRNNPLRYLDEDGHYWVEAVSIAGKTYFQVVRETSKVAAEVGRLNVFSKALDYSSRRQRADTNQPGLLPIFNKYEIPAEGGAYDLELPRVYSLGEGITVDAKVFDAFAKEFKLAEQESLSGATSSMLLMSAQQLHDFHEFHAAFRYAGEIKDLEKRLSKEKDPKKRDKIERDIEKRRSSSAYKKFGKRVAQYL